MIPVMSAPTVADLHMHSRHSDGILEPGELMPLAATRGVTRAALTDHDTMAGCAAAGEACIGLGIDFTPGVEISVGWRGQSLHVLGLAPQNGDPGLAAHLARLRTLRRARITAIGERLQKRARLPGNALAAAVCAETEVPTRMHLARLLVARQLTPDVGEAFKEYLGRGKPGHVAAEWPGLEETLAVLKQAGAKIVLAHPHRYRLSAGALRQLIEEFRGLGGHGMEVSVAGMAHGDLDRLATLARRSGLAASTGSDFHDPALRWNTPGRFVKLPQDLDSIVAHL
jgi:predicted metal-dependent phosphoesterase TrpH